MIPAREQRENARPERAARVSFVAIDQRLLDSEAYANMTALERSVVLSLYRLANITELPWLHHGRRLGVVRRGELTWTLRHIADHARVQKDVAASAIRKLIRSGFVEEVFGTQGPPTTDATSDATSQPTYKPTTPRKLRLRLFLGIEEAAPGGPTHEATDQATSLPTRTRLSTDLQILQICRLLPQVQCGRRCEPAMLQARLLASPR